MNIEHLIEKYNLNRGEYLQNSYNETQLRNEFLDSFFELLGWDIKNDAGKSTNEREVLLEESLREDIETTAKKPDYTFRLFSERKYFVEAKKPSAAVESNPDFAKQIRRYGFTARLKISVLSNFEHLLIYDCSVPVKEADGHHKALIKQYHYTEYVEKFEEIKSLIGKDVVYSGQFDDTWKEIENQLKLFSVDKLFLEQINRWRLLLGEEILKYKTEINDYSLNDIVQSYLNRIIFLRVCEDRNIEIYRTLFSFAGKHDTQALIEKFEEADKQYNSGLFSQYLSDEVIKNVSSVFWDIIRELYFPESPYSFSVFGSDILGNIYEIFLSEKLAQNEGVLSLVKKPEQIDKDIITTPTYIVKDILRQAVIPLFTGKTEQEIKDFTLCDIACGSGAFLIEAYQLLNDMLIDYYLDNDPQQLIQTSISSYKLPFTVKKELLLSCIFGVDRDYNAVEATKFGLVLKILEDENNSSIHELRPILPSLNANIKWGNSLISPSDVGGSVDEIISQINPHDFGDTRFNAIIGNPPYMKSEDMKNITPLEFPIYKKKYVTAYKQFDKYFLFIERGMELLKEGGLLGFIIPNKFAKVGAGLPLRRTLKDHGFIQKIISFGPNQIFENKSTYTCLIILEKHQLETLNYIDINNLAEWKVRRNDDYDQVPIIELDDEGWILVPKELKPAYNKILSQSIPLQEILEDDESIFNGIQTSANDIYIIQPEQEDSDYFYFTHDDRKWKIEKEVTRPYFRTGSGVDTLNTYRALKPNALVMYPYKKVGNKIEFIELAELEEKYPFLFEYLNFNKPKLSNPKRDIKPKPETSNEWYRFGRHQCLEKCDVPEKLVVGVLSQGDKYAVDLSHTFISSGGTAGYCMIVLPDDSPYSIYYIQALLNSKYIEWFSALIGEVFRGGYIARGTKVLKRLPVRKINFDDTNEKNLHDAIAQTQQKLMIIRGKADSYMADPRNKTLTEKLFTQELKKLEQLLFDLYQLGADDSKIPLIKELYATH